MEGGSLNLFNRLNNQTNLIVESMNFFLKKACKKTAFTLAEVLITLGIVGVVAALVIPPVVRGAEEMKFVSMYKKDYALVSAWFKTGVKETGGEIPTFPGGWPQYSAYITSILRYFPDTVVKSKKPYEGVITDYYDPGQMRWSSGQVLNDNMKSHWPHPGGYILNLSNGGVVIVMQWSNYLDAVDPALSAKPGYLTWQIMLDVNGSKTPNQFGKDIFVLTAFTDGTISPYSSTVKCGVGCGQGCSAEKLYQ